ncbi:MAG: hypothetical protein AAB586_02515 [Patescibacteria group bacterium]
MTKKKKVEENITLEGEKSVQGEANNPGWLSNIEPGDVSDIPYGQVGLIKEDGVWKQIY